MNLPFAPSFDTVRCSKDFVNYKNKKIFHNRAKRQDYPLSLQPPPSPSRSPVPPLTLASGVHNEARGVCVRRAVVVQLRARPPAAAAATCGPQAPPQAAPLPRAGRRWSVQGLCRCGLRVEGTVQGRTKGQCSCGCGQRVQEEQTAKLGSIGCGDDRPAGGQRLRVRQPVSHDQLQVALFQADSSIEMEEVWVPYRNRRRDRESIY